MTDNVETAELRAAGEGTPQDWPRLRDYLSAHGLALTIDPPPRQFAGGYANMNYLVRVNDGLAVLRRPPMGPLPPGAYDMSREAKILSRLWERFPLAPRSLHLCQDAGIIGAPFQITEFRAGIAFRDSLPPSLATDAAVGQRLGRMLAEVLAQLHGVDPAAVGLDDLGNPQGFVERSIAGWSKRAGLASAELDNVATRTLIEDIGRWLRAQPVPPGRIALLHNDYKLDNLLLNSRTLDPVAVLDWDQGTRGDPLFDLATTLSYWTEPGDPPLLHRMRLMPNHVAGFPTRREFAELYASLTGCDLTDFRVLRVLGVFKTAVILLQLNARHRSGATTDPRYAEFGEVAAGLLEFALAIAQGRMF